MNVIDQSSQTTQSNRTVHNAVRIGGSVAGVAAFALGAAALWSATSEPENFLNNNNLCCTRGMPSLTNSLVSDLATVAFGGLQAAAAAAIPLFQAIGGVATLAVGAYLDRQQAHQQMNGLNQSVNAVPSKSPQQPSPLFKLDEFEDCRQVLEKTLQSQETCAQPTANQTRRMLAKDRGLASNLRLGEEILSETVRDIRFSANNLARSQRIIEERAREQGVVLEESTAFSRVKNSFCMGAQRYLSSIEADREGGTKFARMKASARYAAGVRIGNCGEMAAVAFFKALEKGIWNVPVDIVKIVNGDHAFLVIGRDPNSDPDDYKTWGSSAVVVDAWSKKIYKVSDLEANLEDYFGLDMTTGKSFLRPFNPKTQGLQVILENKDFGDEISERFSMFEPFLDAEETKWFQEVLGHLKGFRESTDLETKLAHAKKLSLLSRESGFAVATLPSIELLRDLMDHFIELYNQ